MERSIVSDGPGLAEREQVGGSCHTYPRTDYKCDRSLGPITEREVRPVPHKQCKMCDVFFLACRSDALTCSPRCRQRYKRQCDKITAEMATADAAAKKLRADKGTVGCWSCQACGIERPIGQGQCHVCGHDRVRYVSASER